jgi:arylsulfatase A
MPGKGKQLKEIKSPVSSVDFFSTISEMTNSDNPGTVPDGVSIVSLLKSGKMKDRPLFWHYPHYSNQGVEPGSAVRFGKYKLIDNFERGRLELYDLSLDISETNDISKTNPEKTTELFNLLNDWRKSTGAKMMEPNPAWQGIK